MPATIPGHKERRGKGWVAVVEVPQHARPFVGKARIKRGLGTRSEKEADRLLPAMLVRIHAEIAAACRMEPEAAPLWARAEVLAETRRRVARGEEGGISFAVDTGEDPQLVREDVLGTVLEAEIEAVEAKHGEAVAARFAGIVTGTRVPLDAHVERWLREPNHKGKKLPAKTANDWKKIIKDFAAWADKRSDVPTLARVSRRVAGEYVAQLRDPIEEGGRGLSSSRVNTMTTALTSYWKWCGKRGVEGVDEDAIPWRGKAPVRSKDTTKRPFTDAEMVKLFQAEDLKPVMRDLMAMAALTGARIEELCSLKVGMCKGGLLALPGTKSDAAARTIPAHSALKPIVDARCEGKEDDAWLFHELGKAQRGSGKRSAAIGRRFTDLRRDAGVTDIVKADNGKDVDAVTFHCFRHWFATKAIEADMEPETIRKIIGHKEASGDTLRKTYSRSARIIEPMRRVIEAITLPEKVLKAIARPEPT